MSERTARINCLRGLLRELGVFIPAGARQVIPAVWTLVEDADADVPDALRPFLAELCLEIREIEARIDRVEKQLQAMAQQLPVVGQLLTIPRVGCSPPRRCSPSSGTSDASHPLDTWLATSG